MRRWTDFVQYASRSFNFWSSFAQSDLICKSLTSRTCRGTVATKNKSRHFPPNLSSAAKAASEVWHSVNVSKNVSRIMHWLWFKYVGVSYINSEHFHNTSRRAKSECYARNMQGGLPQPCQAVPGDSRTKHRQRQAQQPRGRSSAWGASCTTSCFGYHIFGPHSEGEVTK